MLLSAHTAHPLHDHSHHASIPLPDTSTTDLLSINPTTPALLIILLTALLTLILTYCFTRYYQHLTLFLTPQLRILYTRLSSLSQDIRALKQQSNTLNTPNTFADYAKVQRRLQLLEKQRQHLKDEIRDVEYAPRQIVYKNVVMYLPVLGALMVGHYLLGEHTLVTIPAWSFLHYTPLKWFVGPVGLIPWCLICHRVSRVIVKALP